MGHGVSQNLVGETGGVAKETAMMDNPFLMRLAQRGITVTEQFQLGVFLKIKTSAVQQIMDDSSDAVKSSFNILEVWKNSKQQNVEDSSALFDELCAACVDIKRADLVDFVRCEQIRELKDQLLKQNVTTQSRETNYKERVTQNGQRRVLKKTVASKPEGRQLLVTRQEQYRTASSEAIAAGDRKTASKYLKVSKQFEKVIQAMDENKPVDLSAMPGPPPSLQDPSKNVSGSPKKVPGSAQRIRGKGRNVGNDPVAHDETTAASYLKDNASDVSDSNLDAFMEELDDLVSDDAPARPVTRTSRIPQAASSSTLTTIDQRLNAYDQAHQIASDNGDSRKARRMQRSITALVDMQKKVKAGQLVNENDIPSMVLLPKDK